jgi:hypothetical protein
VGCGSAGATVGASRTRVTRRNFTRGRITHPFLRPTEIPRPPIVACAIDLRRISRNALPCRRPARL